MSRYTYYHVLYVGMINIMMFVPSLLIKDRFNGAVSGMLIAMVIGTIVSLSTMACFEKFPGLGFPELCSRYTPKWFTQIHVLTALLIWLPGGMIAIYAYSETVRMFFYPDMNPYLNMLLMILAATWSCSRSTRTVQFIHEIMVLLSSPFILFFLMKAVFNDRINWDAIRYVAGYINKPPSFMTIAASTFLFSGYISLLIFNRLHTEGFRFRFRWVVPFFGIVFLIVTFFVPIGFHGTVGVEDYVYLWSMTADSMILEYGFINRVLFVFLLLFTGLSLLFVMNTWHTTIMLIRYALHRSVAVEEDPVPMINIWLALAIGALTLLLMKFLNLEKNQIISKIWLVSRFFIEIYFLGLMLYFVWRRKKEQSCA
ncbi:hypothetical protein A8709_11375 [Paenibacillus pectinilyticus]|uniref:Uncharacterized protein n=1 Tax=Paenibacillus pectinilyticus TaxID=512399 RepID=A0A1C1A2K1_9BACL|nr:hypothetical protein [Paenibacillus pectinilyticus]OCT14765.1 hypothetical protein A8709_11375 [Paenibacillus pectinilyticus]